MLLFFTLYPRSAMRVAPFAAHANPPSRVRSHVSQLLRPPPARGMRAIRILHLRCQAHAITYGRIHSDKNTYTMNADAAHPCIDGMVFGLAQPQEQRSGPHSQRAAELPASISS